MTFVPRDGLYIEATRGGPLLVARHHPDASWLEERAAARPADLVLRAPIDEATLEELSDRVCRLADGGVQLLVCDVGGLAQAGLETVAMLARLQLTARRRGSRIRVRNASAQLHDVLSLVGLCRIVGPCAPLRLEARGQAEQWEEPRGVEEERDPGDPIP